MGAKKIEPVSIPEGPKLWSEAFGRTAGLPCVFTFHWSHHEEIRNLLNSFDLPTHHKGGLFSTWYWATPLLDGYILENSTEGFPAGVLPSGIRVVGVNPLRLLCHLLNLKEPKQQGSEDRVPSSDELSEWLDRQEASQSEGLHHDLRSLLFARTVSDLVVLSYKLYGERALPKRIPNQASREIPAPGEWGAQGFSIRDYEFFSSSGIDLPDAAKWVPITEPQSLPNLIKAGITLEEATKWHQKGVKPALIPSLKDVGASPNDVEMWIQAGGDVHHFARARSAGISLEELHPFIELGYSSWVFDLLEHDISIENLRDLHQQTQPKTWEQQIIIDFAIRKVDSETIARWMKLGIELPVVQLAIHHDLPVDIVEHYARAGKTVELIEKFVRKQARSKR